MRKYLLSGFLIVVISACAQAEAKHDLEVKPTATNELAASSTISSADKTGGAVIIYQRSGGLAGIAEEWRIYPSGLVVSGDGQENKVDPGEISALLSEIEALGFFEMRDSDRLSSSCRDCFVHQIIVSSGESINSIRVEGGVSDSEDQRLEIVKKINEFVSGLSNERDGDGEG